MSVNKFKTLRHIETVRNYLNSCIKELLHRQEQHDQSKLQSPEAEIFEIYTPKLRGLTYGSPEYQEQMKEMDVAIKHHTFINRHHPEYHADGILGMNLVDLLELICDWKAATLRHDNGDVSESLDMNQKRFGYTDELKTILNNTIKWLNEQEVYHKANES